MPRAFRWYPICQSSIGLKWFGLATLHNSGSGPTISITWTAICFTIYSYTYKHWLQTTSFSVIFEFLVALLQNTTHITTTTTMAAASGNGPLAPYMRPCALREWIGYIPPSLRMYFGGVEGVCGCSFVPAMMNCHNIGVFWEPYTPSTPQKNTSASLGVVAHPYVVPVRSARPHVGH